MRKRSAFLTFCFLTGTATAQTPTPPVAPIKPVTDTYFGTTVTDPYRYLENTDDTAVISWLHAQGAYARSVLDAMSGHAALLSDLSKFSASFDFVNGTRRGGNRLFYLEQTPGSDDQNLIVRNVDGKSRKLVDISAWRAAHPGKPYAINYFLPSPNGEKVAVGISEGGSENASVYVYDASTGKQIAGPLPRETFVGPTAWSSDSRNLFLNQLADLPSGAPESETYQNSRAFVWDLKSAPVALLGGKTYSNINVPAETFPFITTAKGSSFLVAGLVNGVENDLTLFTAPASDVAKGDHIKWSPLATRSDGVTNFAIAGNHIFLLSHKDAPTFKVLELNAGQPLSTAKTIIPVTKTRLIEGITASSDALYVQVRNGVYSELLRAPYGGGAVQALALPFKGSITEMNTDFSKMNADPNRGVVINISSWSHPQSIFAYDPESGQFRNLNLASAPDSFHSDQLVTHDLSAVAGDGTPVPLSLTLKKDHTGPGLVLLNAYGSYGMSLYPGFGPRTVFAMMHDVAFGVCHVRGGGELGEEWRLAGKDATKPNTWRDLIACGDYLVKQGYTTPDKLFIVGGSAGGITVGRAMEERPELFAGVIAEVPAANPVRFESTSTGVLNIPEFGTVKTEQGFRNLYAMDSYLHVENGKNYPPILITTGLNDPRVPSWSPAKFAARLQASGTKKPVLLRVEVEGGHGFGSTRSQEDELFADKLTFIFWQAGVPGRGPGNE